MESDDDLLRIFLEDDDDDADDDDERNINEEGNNSALAANHLSLSESIIVVSNLCSGRQLRLLINVHIWRRLGDPTFEQHFRMDRRTFEVCVLMIL